MDVPARSHLIVGLAGIEKGAFADQGFGLKDVRVFVECFDEGVPSDREQLPCLRGGDGHALLFERDQFGAREALKIGFEFLGGL